jgi:hypothetical protein
MNHDWSCCARVPIVGPFSRIFASPSGQRSIYNISVHNWKMQQNYSMQKKELLDHY